MKKEVNTISRVAVLDKSFTIIFFLNYKKKEVGLTEISKQTNINKTTCYRILQTLITHNIIENGNNQGTYRLGIGLLKLGDTVQKNINLREVALPYLEKLTKDTDMTTYLCVLRNDKSLCVDRVEGAHVKILLLNVGDEWPLYVGGAPRAMLSFLSDFKIKEILSKIEETNLTKYASNRHEDYWSLIQSTRAKGYNVSYDDVLSGVSSIGAPLFNHHGKVVGAISISNTSNIINPDTEKDLAEKLVVTSRKISKSLGWKI